jgi:hypothetical protein
VKIILFLLYSISSFSAVTVSNVTGVSNLVRETDASITVYGGIQGGTGVVVSGYPDCTTSGTCDTCIGNVAVGNVQVACNRKGVFTDTIITIPASTTVTTANAKYLLCNGTTEVATTTNLSTVLSTTWSEVCSRISTGNSTCGTNVSQTLTFGVGADCSSIGNEKVNIKFVTRFLDITPGVLNADQNTYTPSPPASPEPNPGACTTTGGACFFRVYPGDGKVYFDRDLGLGIAADFPATGATGVTYDKLVLFLLGTGTTGDDFSNDIATFNSITTAANLGEVSVSAEGDVSSASIDDLANDERFCFKMGSQDTAGNIDHISSADCSVAGAFNDPASDCRNTCTTPSEVLGLLADANCFIATAAYGSSLDQHVNRLREFKNKILVPTWVGRKFVKLYYIISPPIAKLVAKNEVLKSFVRVFLWPVILIADLILDYGFAIFLVPLILVAVYLRRRRQVFS